MIEINKIYCEDCLETMARMPDSFVDLVITSPPYNLGNNHHTGNNRHNPYDDDMEENEYQDLQIKVLSELFRVLKKDGWLFYNHKNRIKNGIMISPYEWIFRTRFIIKQEVIWKNGSQNFDKIRYYPFTERIYCLAKSDKSWMNNKLGLSDLWNISPVGTNGAHKRAFPERLVGNIILSVPYAKLIYDPYSGSNTVGKMAIKLDRNWIASEISAEYVYGIAEKRINYEKSKLKFDFEYS